MFGKGKKKNEPEGNGAVDGKEDKEPVGIGAYDVTEHTMGIPEVAQLLATHVDAERPDKSQGLSQEEVRSLAP